MPLADKITKECREIKCPAKPEQLIRNNTHCRCARTATVIS